MKEMVKKEYIRRIWLILKSKLNGGNMIKAINTWAVAVIRYPAGILDWTLEDAKKIDAKTRKNMTMNGALHPRTNVGRLILTKV